jgi:hypothetical protein
MERWLEEVEISEEEFHRLVCGCNMMDQVWSTLASAEKKAGYAAYARQKAHMFRCMATNAHEKFEAARGTWPAANVTVAEHARTYQPPIEINWETSS